MKTKIKNWAVLCMIACSVILPLVMMIKTLVTKEIWI